ncbi:MAG TPA: helix-turn-helix domain-containing protein [Solirubrobacterales bacterium]|jgi:transcriptional regulator of acetoin/glycerol metabolism
MRPSERQQQLLEAREVFLSGGGVPGCVRGEILSSWRRSLSSGVDPDKPVQVRFGGLVDGDNALLRAARPVAEGLFESMPTVSVAMLVAERQGRVLERWGTNRALLHLLDDIGGAPGYIWAEETTGTGALATVFEVGGPVAVSGAEHFVDQLTTVAAFGAPIVHPVSRRIEGAVDLVCSIEDASELMMPLIVRAAEEISTRLLSGYAASDRALLDGFLRADRRGPRRPIVALNDRIMITNPLAADLLGTMNQTVLSENVRRALVEHRNEFEMPSSEDHEHLFGVIHELRDARDRTGAVVQLRPGDAEADPHPALRQSSHVEEQLRSRLPGTSAAWAHLLRQSAIALRSHQRILIVGESGVGKRTLAMALSAVADGSLRPVELDAGESLTHYAEGRGAELTEAVMSSRRSVLLTHLEQLDERALELICRWLDELPPSAPRILATYCMSYENTSPAAGLLARFPGTIDVTPLRDRVEDIPEIVASIAAGPGSGEPEPKFDNAALRQLMALEWPGNLRQLSQVVMAATAASAGSRVRVEDLPRQQFSVAAARRPLTRLERSERVMIASALAEAEGNKRTAAANLGISRSTLYRKLKALELEA